MMRLGFRDSEEIKSEWVGVDGGKVSVFGRWEMRGFSCVSIDHVYLDELSCFLSFGNDIKELIGCIDDLDTWYGIMSFHRSIRRGGQGFGGEGLG